MDTTRVFITTPIYYVNGNPHVGHAHTSVMADILRREYLLRGVEVFFTTGVDEHGQKNQAVIEASGLTAKEYLDHQSEIFESLFNLLNVQYDKFVRTSNVEHIKAVQHILQEVYDKGLIVKKEYEGLYCIGCEMFKTAADLDENGCCVDHQTKPILMKESNYFFKLSVYQQWLIDYINTHPLWIQPSYYRNEILHMLEEPLPDLCISRTKKRCSLGIELPFDKDYVAYVWFDALINYISSLGYPKFTKRSNELWGNSIHLMAKDIIKTHCIYWPIMLKAIGLEPQKTNFVHGYWTGEGGFKMSKTIGNVVDPFEAIEEFGVDPFRYYLARSMKEGEAPMSLSLIKGCYNSEIVNTISNAIYRTMKLAYKAYAGIYPEVDGFRACDEEFLDSILQEINQVVQRTPSLEQITARAELVCNLARMINGFFDKSAPWALAKKEDQCEFNSCILTCVEALRLMGETAFPIMPKTATDIVASMGLNLEGNEKQEFTRRRIRAGKNFSEPVIFFQRKD